ncbi:protein-glutamate O-methyltransferase CheR [Lysinibacillus yapensis]|uniref:Protein-glutamate O-methyltransferase CheR n=1 Tax=Ureibacillus yapensis TaxID=2304605 RepID=A0A396S8M0_9BACL|nr:protein-glutamate O-methyltransferase CheR [Lysinibacillus yapensis]RHW37435.1 protein-glutamate O-methyltransferase CheR [Lysinibacillus yapensis]
MDLFSLPLDEQEENLEKLEIHLLLEGIYLKYGYDYRNYAYPSIKRRVWHRIHAEQLTSISSLLEKVLHDSSCFARLRADFSINVTEMFRDPLFFKTFKEQVVPLLKTYPSIRIWHAGCATGEEVFSMAILLQEVDLYEKTKIYATDINTDVLKIAKTGCFSLENMKKYTSNYMIAGGERAFSNYYKVTDAGVQFHSYLTRNVVFAQHNLVTDNSFNEFHVILCRNVLIYFNKELQNRVHELFYNSLGKLGVLCLGNKESVNYTDYKDFYEEINRFQKIYKKIK